MSTTFRGAALPALIFCCLVPLADFSPAAPIGTDQTLPAVAPAASVTIPLPPATKIDGTTIKLPLPVVEPTDEVVDLGSSITVSLPPVVEMPSRPSLAELVARHATITPGSYQTDCLARAVYFESRGEPLEGQLAVAEVVLNRTRHASFPRKICDVVRAPDQFSFVKKGVIPNPNISTKAWRRAVAIAHIAIGKLRTSRASKSLYFHATYVSPSWRHEFDRTIQLGRHIFYSANLTD